MKQKISIITVVFHFAILLLFTGCKANYPVTQESGMDDVAYLLFESSSNNSYEIDVVIDDTTKFTAKTVKTKDANRKGTSYTVSTGKRKLVVTRKGVNLYEKYIFLSPQETKRITLQ